MKYAIVLILAVIMGCPGEYEAANPKPQYVYEINEMLDRKEHYSRVGNYYRRLALESYAMEFGSLLARRDYQQKYGDLP